MMDVHPVSRIIDAIGVVALSRAFGHANASTVSSWKLRHSIPVERWPRLIEVAKERGLEEITVESLLEACTSAREAAE